MKKEVILVLLVFVIIGFVSADFSIGNLSHSIEKEYAPNENLIGWINLSLDYERANAKLFDSNNNSIEILKLIEQNPGFNYTCHPQGCAPDYAASDGEPIKSFVISEGAEQTLGFELLGSRKVNSVKFTISNNAPTSCKNPLKIDFLGDGIYEISSNVSSSQVCPESKDYACFKQNLSMIEYTLGTTPYCQKFTLNEAPGFRVGAWVKKLGSDSADLRVFLFEGDQDVATCQLTEASSSGGEIFCDLNFAVTNPKTYYVCVYAAESGLYTIRANQNPQEKCGFYRIPVKPLTSAYQISVQTKKFGTNPVINIQNTLPNGRSIATLMQNYIITKYGSAGCLEGCTIPMVVKSGVNQTLTFKNLELSYETTSGMLTSHDFYNLIESPAKIDSGFQKLFFNDAGFILPGEYGEFEYNLNLNGQDIFTEDLEIIKVAIIKDLNPKIAKLVTSTEFTVEVESEKNITDYLWQTSSETKHTSNNTATLTFNLVDINKINISVTDSDNNTVSKTFDIYVYSPKNQIEDKIAEIKAKIQNLKTKIGAYSIFYRNSIEEAINLAQIESSLAIIESKYAIVNGTSEYLEIIDGLEEMEVPSGIITTESLDEIPFTPKKENIKFNYIESASGGNYNSEYEEEYLNALLLWYQQNIDLKLSFKEIGVIGESGTDFLFKFFELDIKGDLISNPYLIIEDFGELKFAKNYGQSDTDEFYYLKLTPGQETIIFSTTQDIEFISLPAYISPYLDDLDVNIPSGNDGEGSSKWIFFVLIIFFILVVGFVVYILLQEWYKKKYEGHLFKDRNNLFNLVTYINNQRKKGISDDEIVKKLEKAKWSSEQINYALKKYKGKRTGMYELPIFNIFKRKEKQQPDYRGHFGLSPGGFPRGKPI